MRLKSDAYIVYYADFRKRQRRNAAMQKRHEYRAQKQKKGRVKKLGL